MIVIHVGLKHAAQVPCVEDDDIVETLASNAANDSLRVGILPWTLGSNFDVFDAHILDALLKLLTVDRDAIPKEIPWRLIPWEGLDDLLCRPLRRWVFGDVEVDDAPALMSQQDEHEEHPALDGRHGEKTQATRSLTWLLKKAFHVGDGGLRTVRRYFSTVDLAMMMPSLRSSPTMRGEPHVRLERHISWMSSRTSFEMVGRPGFPV